MKLTKIWPWVIGIVVLITVNLPLIYFYLTPAVGRVFLGRRVINSEDTYTYLAFIQQAKEGRWLFENLYTTEAQKPTLLRVSYALIGKVAAVFDLTPMMAYQGARLILSALFIWVLNRFLRRFFESAKERLVALFVVLTASGIGFLFRTTMSNAITSGGR